MVHIMTVNLIVVVAHRANLTQHLYAGAKLFLQFSMNRLFGCLANFNAASSCFDKGTIAENIISNDTDKVEESLFVYNNRPGNVSIVRNLSLFPLRIF